MESEREMDNARSELQELVREFKRKRREFESSWFPALGEKLLAVKSARSYRSWCDKEGRSFRSFTQYCSIDLKFSATVCSDIVAAYKYVLDNHPELIEPSDSVRRKMVPGYNEINIVRRARKHLSNRKFKTIDSLLFKQLAGRDRLREAIASLLPKRARTSGIEHMKDELTRLKARVVQLEAELSHLRSHARKADLWDIDLKRLRRRVAKYIHPDVGGDNDLMRDFNVLVDRLIEIYGA